MDLIKGFGSGRTIFVRKYSLGMMVPLFLFHYCIGLNRFADPKGTRRTVEQNLAEGHWMREKNFLVLVLFFLPISGQVTKPRIRNLTFVLSNFGYHPFPIAGPGFFFLRTLVMQKGLPFFVLVTASLWKSVTSWTRFSKARISRFFEEVLSGNVDVMSHKYHGVRTLSLRNGPECTWMKFDFRTPRMPKISYIEE